MTDDELIVYIQGFMEEFGYPPSVRDLAQAMSVSSTSTVWSRLKKLQVEGRVSWTPGRSRTLRLLS